MYRTEVARGEEEPTAPDSLRDQSTAAHTHFGPSWGTRVVKRLMDVVGATLFFVLFLPLFLAVAIGVRLSSPGPILFVQPRVGRDGREFRFYKFRSMSVDAEEVLSTFLESDREAKARWEKYQKVHNDPRITWFGRMIRRTSLDELPQFWNVFKGDMSLVGPRPCMVQQRDLYGRHWRAYCAVAPGITGLWQVSGRNRLTYRQRVTLDARYVERMSVFLDLTILAKTVLVVLHGNDAH